MDDKAKMGAGELSRGRRIAVEEEPGAARDDQHPDDAPLHHAVEIAGPGIIGMLHDLVFVRPRNIGACGKAAQGQQQEQKLGQGR